MKVVDLFSGAGGLSLGFCNAGFKIITAYDNWPEAIKTYKENFLNHRAKVIDLVELSNPKHPEILFLKKEKPEVIMGGPPCQDFSQAGSRNGNGEKGNLTPVFARIITTIRPEWVVMENVNTIKSIGKEQLKICIDILKEADYGLTLKILNAKDYGVPQNRKRLFLIGRLNGRDEEMSSVLESKKIGEITVREYYPEIAHGKNATEYYYRHPRTYGRRAIFSIDEVSPTIRGVNRPIPGTYKFHEGDKIKDKSLVRPLTYKERAILQSFPPDFKWTGSKANNEQLIGNAVPPKLASVIAESIIEFNTFGLKRYMRQNINKNTDYPSEEKLEENNPSLFGIKHSNRDYTKKEAWGKNQFTSSFPASLACYMYHKNHNAVYLKSDGESQTSHATISIRHVFEMSPKSKDLFFAFETSFAPYQRMVIDNLPRVDLVIQNRKSGDCIKPIEIKLTALPDNTTCELDENQYGTELVIRPDTIVYLACSIGNNYFRDRNRLREIVTKPSVEQITNWTHASNIIPSIPDMVDAINDIVNDLLQSQTPFILQPIWKTKGKTPELADNCLDIFIWSDLAFVELIKNIDVSSITSISRQVRTIVWLFKMLYDFANNGQFDHNNIIDQLSFNTKNDKAFANSGIVTHPFMKCERLDKPIIKKTEIKNIILGGGQELLSPERRFDAILFYSPELFE